VLTQVSVKNPMIEMGASTLSCGSGTTPNCPGVQIEHLELNGISQSASTYGIKNAFSQELGYVNDVAFTNMSTAGLYLSTSHASNSGPYTNLTMSNVQACVEINGTNGTRGFHGLTCSLVSSASAGVFLDARNNSLEDIYISGTSAQDGILIGDAAPAQSNILFNIRGSTLKNVIHISSDQTSGSTNCPPSSGAYNVCDLTILGVTRSGGTNSIEDDLTGPTLTNANVGMYIVGEPVQAGSSFIGYSRFTSSTSLPSWLVGTGAPSGSSCTVGDLYSRTSGGSGTSTVYGCVGTSWTAIK
jgi:hypothetical protein